MSELRQAGIGALGFAPGRVNVYAVRTIDQDPHRVILGHAEIGGEYVAVAEPGWGRQTFAHELGHILGLAHTNNVPGFQTNNLMWAGGSPARGPLTEGQIFRMHYDRGSAFFGVLGVVGLEETRGCQSGWSFYSAGCPKEELRLFAEGAEVAGREAAGAPSPVYECRVGEWRPGAARY